MGLWPGHPGWCHPCDLWSVNQSQFLESTVMAEEEAKQKEALNATLKEYIAEWRKTREKEEEELKKLKEKQAKRKEIRAEQERKRRQGRRKLRGRPWKLRRRRRSLKRQKPRDRRCWMPKRPALVPRSLLLGREPVMLTRRCPRPRSNWRRRRRSPSPSESSLSTSKPWTLMSLNPRLRNCSTLWSPWRLTNMITSRRKLIRRGNSQS